MPYGGKHASHETPLAVTGDQSRAQSIPPPPPPALHPHSIPGLERCFENVSRFFCIPPSVFIARSTESDKLLN